MRIYLAVALSLLVAGCIKQKSQEHITYEPLPEPPPQEIIMVTTDSSHIETKCFEYLNSTREFNRLDSIDRTYFRDYYFDTNTLNRVGVFEEGDYAGLWKYYNKKEELIKEINYETGEKILCGNTPDPFDNDFFKIKATADSILVCYFGSAFFHDHIQWNASQSHFISDNGSGTWFDVSEGRPFSFMLNYSVLFDKQHTYPTIQFTLDRFGRLSDITGFKSCEPDECRFALNFFQALALGRNNGLTLSRSSKYFFFLSWIKPSEKTEFLGDYELVIAELKDIVKGGPNETIENYDAVVINPWTGALIRTSEFQRFRYTHRFSSSLSALLEKKPITRASLLSEFFPTRPF